MITMIRSIISSVAEGVIKRFSGIGRPGETIASREYFQHYGFTSRPRAGAEGVCLKQGNNVIMIASDDRRYRIAVEDGEVALYTDEGHYLHFKRGGTLEISCPNITMIGDVAVTGSISATGSIVDGGGNTNNHSH